MLMGRARSSKWEVCRAVVKSSVGLTIHSEYCPLSTFVSVGHGCSPVGTDDTLMKPSCWIRSTSAVAPTLTLQREDSLRVRVAPKVTAFWSYAWSDWLIASSANCRL